MATLDECRTALEQLVGGLARNDEARARMQSFERTISCHVPDLGTTFSGRLVGGHLRDVTTDAAPKAQIRFTSNSDDLVAMTDGRLQPGEAYKAGRLKVSGSMMDLLKLRSMF